MHKNDEILLSEATFEQIASEINTRCRDFLFVSTAMDGSHGRHSLLYYGNPYGALGLANFAKGFLLTMMLEGPSQPSSGEITDEEVEDGGEDEDV